MPAKLTDDQISKYIEAFYHFDADRDDFISRDELFSLLEAVSIPADPDFLLSALKELDIDHDRIGKRELLSIAKILLDRAAPKQDKALVGFSISGMGKKVTEWFDGEDNGNTMTSFFHDDTIVLGNRQRGGGARVADSSTLPRSSAGRPDSIVVHINNESDDGESDYEYYTDDSDEDDKLFDEDAPLKPSDVDLFPRRGSLKPPDYEASHRLAATNPPDYNASQRRKSLNPVQEKVRSVSNSVTAISVPTSNREDGGSGDALIGRSKPPAKKPQRQRGNKKVHVNEDGPTIQKTATMKPLSTPKNSKAAALSDPKVRKQLASIKEYRPRFLIIMTVVQILLFAYEIIHNGGFEPLTTNFFVGPSRLTLTQLGANYAPCMRPDPTITADFYTTCHTGIPAEYVNINGSCLYFNNLAFVCGMGGFANRTKPEQIWRFFTAIFLHTGVIHILFDLFVQIKLGFKMEKQMGSIRMAIIYLTTGICGYIFAGLMSPDNVSVGSSGCLYGLFALLYLDLFHSWPILKNPKRHLALLTAMVIVALGLGLLPYFDNYAHIGGFVSGFFVGMIFMPTVHFSAWDKRKKIIMRLLSVPILLAGIGMGIYGFYVVDSDFCPFCTYLNCLPPGAAWCQQGA